MKAVQLQSCFMLLITGNLGLMSWQSFLPKHHSFNCKAVLAVYITEGGACMRAIVVVWVIAGLHSISVE